MCVLLLVMGKTFFEEGGSYSTFIDEREKEEIRERERRRHVI